MWFVLAGFDYREAIHFLANHGAISPASDAPEAFLSHRWGVKPEVIYEHTLFINMSREFPTIEIKIMTGLLKKKRLLVAELESRVRWAFSLLRTVAEPYKPMPFALLGIPTPVGLKPSSKQINYFLDLLFHRDRLGRDLARKRFAAVKNAPAGYSRALELKRKEEIRQIYTTLGLQRVYRLHEAHDGIDTQLIKHLSDPVELKLLAEDLNRANASFNYTKTYFPEEFHSLLQSAMAVTARAWFEKFSRKTGLFVVLLALLSANPKIDLHAVKTAA